MTKEPGKRNENEKCDCITTLYACFVIIAVVAIIIMVASISGLGDTSKVLSLVGILATFVVISNYAQMVEMRKDTEKRMIDMGEQWKEAHKDLDEKIDRVEQIMKKSNSNVIADIKKIKYQLAEENDEGKIVELLNSLLVYEDTEDDTVRISICEALGNILGKAAFSRDIASASQNVAFSVLPMDNPYNEAIGYAQWFGKELFHYALSNKKLMNGFYGYVIMKRISMITNNSGDLISELNYQRNRFPDDAVTLSYLGTLLNDVNKRRFDLPVFGKEVQDWIDNN